MPELDLATDWKRSNPEIVVYIPRGGDLNDTDNEHFLVFEAPKSDEYLAMWTQSSCEGRGDNHIVLARSADGAEWGEPVLIVGTPAGTTEPQGSWGFPVVSDSGRLYCFYLRECEVPDNHRQSSGALGCMVSDDNGHSWSDSTDIPMPRNRLDHPDPSIPLNWIVWQKPIRDSQGRWIVGYTHCASHTVCPSPEGWWVQDSRCSFIRFDNIDDGPDPADLRLTWMPTDREGLEVPHRNYPDIPCCQEPSLVLLPDGRLFTTMRTMDGYVWYSVSSDDGETWRDPEVLRYSDGGEKVPHPLSPCPIYQLADGRYVLIFHNNAGRIGNHDQFEFDWKTNHLNFIRNPTYITVGHFDPDAHQPIRFDPPVEILNTNDLPIGPKGTAEIATYTSLTERDGKRILWYPDRKYYLLGLFLTDEVLANGR